jgi:hypothetical protein
MLMSKSEHFWLSVLRGILNVETLEEPPLPEDYMPVICAEMEEEVVTLYGQIMKYSEMCGLGAVEACRGLKEPVGAMLPMEACWVDCEKYGATVEIADIQHLIETLKKEAAEVRSQCVLDDQSETDRLLACFDVVSAEPLSHVIGYSRKTPDSIYGLAGNGEIVVRCKINFSNITGFVRHVLKTLSPHIAIPRVVADKFLGETHHVSDSGIPNPECCLVVEGKANPKKAAEVIDAELNSFVGEDEKEVALGKSLGVAIECLRTLQSWIYWEIDQLNEERDHIFRLGHRPVKAELGEQGRVEVDEGEERLAAAAGPESIERANKIVEKALKQFVFDDKNFSMKSETRSRLRQIKSSLDKAGVLCKELHVESAAAVFDKAIEKVFDVLDEQRSSQGRRGVTERLDGQIDSRERLLEQLPVLEAMIPLVYGELRLRELLESGEHCDVDGGVREGLSIREQNEQALGLAYKLLRQGAAPAICVSIVTSQYESIINRFAEYVFKEYKHAFIEEFGQLEIRRKISRLRETVPSDRKDLLRFLSVADSLRLIRNPSIHSDDNSLFGDAASQDQVGKHEARFFLEGIAIMLQVLGKAQSA